MPKYIVHVYMLFLICFCTDMAEEEDEQQRRNREARMHKGKDGTTASARKERVEQNLYVPKTRKRRDARLVEDSSQSQMDYSSHVVDPTQAHEYARYAGDLRDMIGCRRRLCFISRMRWQRTRMLRQMILCLSLSPSLGDVVVLR